MQGVIRSNKFYTSHYGYKVYATLYPNGYGSVKDKFVSMCVVFVNGEYDSILKWPYTGKITFTLMDQSAGNKHHYKKSFFASEHGQNVITRGIPFGKLYFQFHTTRPTCPIG